MYESTEDYYNCAQNYVFTWTLRSVYYTFSSQNHTVERIWVEVNQRVKYPIKGLCQSRCWKDQRPILLVLACHTGGQHWTVALYCSMEQSSHSRFISYSIAYSLCNPYLSYLFTVYWLLICAMCAPFLLAGYPTPFTHRVQQHYQTFHKSSVLYLYSLQVSMSFSFRMGRSTVHSVIIETCSVLWKVLSKEYARAPSSLDEWQEVSRDFFFRWNFLNCVGECFNMIRVY